MDDCRERTNTSSDEFKKVGGQLEILQLWINLPTKYKFTDPKYIGLQKEEIPVVSFDDDKVQAHIITGTWNNTKASITPLTDISLAYINFRENGRLNRNIPSDKTVFLYVVKGSLIVNGEPSDIHEIIQFSHEGTMIEIKALTNALILFGYATPLQEPFVAYGPFVMNTQEEIMQAYEDYNAGKFGSETAFS